MSELGRYRKFQASRDVGGEHFKGRPLAPVKNLVKKTEDFIVMKLRERAQRYELAAEDALFGRSITCSTVAEELRACSTSIRLKDWTGMKEP